MLIDYLKPIVLAVGLLFIMAGLSILITEQPAYSGPLTMLFQAFEAIFAVYVLLLFISMILMTYNYMMKAKNFRR